MTTADPAAPGPDAAPGPPAVPPGRFPTPVQAVVITLSGIVMAFFGCLGALTQIDSGGPLMVAGGTVFAIGMLAFVFGVALVGFLFFRGVWQIIQEKRKK